jgi:hypothetical protein
MRTMSRARLKACALGYATLGWTGYVPQDCHDALIVVPLNYTWVAWGWPNTFVERMAAANSEVFAIGPLGDGYGTTGVDTLELLNRLPTDYAGGIMTEHIEVIAKAARTACCGRASDYCLVNDRMHWPWLRNWLPTSVPSYVTVPVIGPVSVSVWNGGSTFVFVTVYVPVKVVPETVASTEYEYGSHVPVPSSTSPKYSEV